MGLRGRRIADGGFRANASRVLAACGLEPSDAIRLFLQEMKRRSQVRDHRIAESVDVSAGQMLLVRPERLRGAKVRWLKASLV